MATKPTHEQAQLHLQVYDLRREARLREARDWFFKNYIVNSMDDVMRIAAPGTQSGAFAMMVITYWEQSYALLKLHRHGRCSWRKTSSRTWSRPRSVTRPGVRAAPPAMLRRCEIS